MSGVRVALIAVGFSITSGSAWASDLRAAQHVAVAICDLEGVPNVLIDLAEEVAGEVYRDAGVELEWADHDCHPGDGVFAVNVTSREMAGTLVSDHTIGFAETGTRDCDGALRPRQMVRAAISPQLRRHAWLRNRTRARAPAAPTEGAFGRRRDARDPRSPLGR
jgi:hypothetical protein